jgi:hypothetical protein
VGWVDAGTAKPCQERGGIETGLGAPSSLITAPDLLCPLYAIELILEFIFYEYRTGGTDASLVVHFAFGLPIKAE